MNIQEALSPDRSLRLYGSHVRANDIRQHYLRYGGKGRPLVVIPGITSPAALWGFVGERLGKSFDAYILDVRGRGLSEAGSHLDYGLNACAQDVISFVQSLGLADAVVLGHSMGARIVIRAARLGGASAFGHAILVDPPVSGPGRRAYPSSLESYITLSRAAQRGEAEAILRAPGQKRVWPEELIKVRNEWAHTCDERAIRESYKGFHEDDIHADLPLIRIPTGLMAAGEGGVILPEDEQEISRLLPAMTICRVAGAGHQIQIDNFDGFFEALGRLLSKSAL